MLIQALNTLNEQFQANDVGGVLPSCFDGSASSGINDESSEDLSPGLVVSQLEAVISPPCNLFGVAEVMIRKPTTR